MPSPRQGFFSEPYNPNTCVSFSSKCRIGALAYQTLLDIGAHSLPIYPLGILTQRKDVIKIKMDQDGDILAPGVLAVTVTLLADHHMVVFSPDQNRGRLAFTLAHELGHIVLGHPSEEPTPDRAIQQEREANVFASHLLIPQDILDAMDKYGNISEYELSQRTGVTMQCASVALARRRIVYPEEIHDEMRKRFSIN